MPLCQVPGCCNVLNRCRDLYRCPAYSWVTIETKRVGPLCSCQNIRIQLLTHLDEIQTHKRFKRMLIYWDTKWQTHNLQIFRVIPFVRLQNDTYTKIKQFKWMSLGCLERMWWTFLCVCVWVPMVVFNALNAQTRSVKGHRIKVS